jgi:hypothetical protein
VCTAADRHESGYLDVNVLEQNICTQRTTYLFSTKDVACLMLFQKPLSLRVFCTSLNFLFVTVPSHLYSSKCSLFQGLCWSNSPSSQLDSCINKRSRCWYTSDATKIIQACCCVSIIMGQIFSSGKFFPPLLTYLRLAVTALSKSCNEFYPVHSCGLQESAEHFIKI